MQLKKIILILKSYIITIYDFINTVLGKFLNNIILFSNKRKRYRCLELGPGIKRIDNFETLNIVGGRNVDYVYDASKKLPFSDNTFDIVYASHILEHIPWYHTEQTLKEWVRILKRGGQLEVWVPDGLKICKAVTEAEEGSTLAPKKDGWFRFNPDKNPYIWASGRLFTYGDGTGNINNPNWHRSMYTPKYLKQLLINVGLKNVRLLDNSRVRGHDHGWINLGFEGVK